MCFICDIKEAGASDEVVKIAQKVGDMLFKVLEICEHKHNQNKGLFSEQECKFLDEVAAITQPGQRLSGLVEMLRSVNVNVKIIPISNKEELISIINKLENQDDEKKPH